MKIPYYIKTLVVLPVFLCIALGVLACKKNKSELYKEIQKKYEQEPHNPSIIEEFMMVTLLETEKTQNVISLYESHKELLAEKVMASIYYATALCRFAGETKEANQKLMYVRKGMHEFETLMERWPEEGRVYIWQAITYSNFPTILETDELVVELIQEVNSHIEAGRWIFEQGELQQLVFAYLNLALEYKSKDYIQAAKEQALFLGLQDNTKVVELIQNTEKRLK